MSKKIGPLAVFKADLHRLLGSAAEAGLTLARTVMYLPQLQGRNVHDQAVPPAWGTPGLQRGCERRRLSEHF